MSRVGVQCNDSYIVLICLASMILFRNNYFYITPLKLKCNTWYDNDITPQAYVQQLESSRLKLTQLEQELQRARQQVGFNYLLELDSVFFFFFLMTLWPSNGHGMFNLNSNLLFFSCRESLYQTQVIKHIQWVEMVSCFLKYFIHSTSFNINVHKM